MPLIRRVEFFNCDRGAFGPRALSFCNDPLTICSSERKLSLDVAGEIMPLGRSAANCMGPTRSPGRPTPDLGNLRMSGLRRRRKSKNRRVWKVNVKAPSRSNEAPLLSYLLYIGMVSHRIGQTHYATYELNLI